MNRRTLLAGAGAAAVAAALPTTGVEAALSNRVERRWPTTNGKVLCLAAYPNPNPAWLLVGGSFSYVTTGRGRVIPATNLFAVNLADPERIILARTAPVWSLAVHGTRVLAGTADSGVWTAPYFTGERRLVTVGASRGVAIDADRLYAASDSGFLGAYTYNGAQVWGRSVDGGVRTVLPTSHGLYAGGWSSASTEVLMKLDPATGRRDRAFDMFLQPTVPGTHRGDYVLCLAPAPGGLLIGSGGYVRNMAWYVDWATGMHHVWPGRSRGRKMTGDVQAIRYVAGRVVVGYHRNHETVGLPGQGRFLSAIDPAGPTVDPVFDLGLWGTDAPNEGDNGGVQAVVKAGGRMFVGGSFLGHGDTTDSVGGWAPPGVRRQSLVGVRY